MSKRISKAIALLLAVVLLVCTLPVSVSAAIPSIPTLKASYSVIESYAGLINQVTVPAGADMYRTNIPNYRMAGWLPYKFTKLSDV